MTLNPTAGHDSFSTDSSGIPAGETRIYPLTQFKNAAGARFDDGIDKAKAFSLSASTPGGKGNWLGKW